MNGEGLLFIGEFVSYSCSILADSVTLSFMKMSSWHFFLPVPKPLPVEDGYANYLRPSSTVRFLSGEERPSSDSATFLFHQVKARGNAFSALEAITNTVDKRTTSRSTQEEFPLCAEQLAFTIVEVAVSKSYGLDPLTVDGGDKDSISEAFNFAVEQLNVWLDALSIVTGQPYEHVRRESLPPATLVAEGAFEPWELEGRVFPKVRAQAVFGLNANSTDGAAHPKPVDGLDFKIEAALMAASVPGPFVSYSRLLSQARHHLHIRGDYAISVILFASACEALFDELLQHLLWEKGALPHEVTSLFLNQGKQPKGIVSLVKNDLYPFLTGERWNNGSSAAISDWQKKVADMRNSVIHSDYRPKFDEVRETAQTVGTLIDFIADKVFAIREAYPITALALLGEKGLKQRDDWERFSTLELTPEIVNMRMKTFRRWSRLVEAHREAPTLYGSKVDVDDSYAVLVVEGETAVEAFAVNKTKIVAKRIDLLEARGNPGFHRHFDKNFNSWPREKVATFSTDPGGFSLPDGARWELYAYEVVPWDLFQFSDLASQVGYDFSVLATTQS